MLLLYNKVYGLANILREILVKYCIEVMDIVMEWEKFFRFLILLCRLSIVNLKFIC